MKNLINLILAVLCINISLSGQVYIGPGTSVPDPSAILELNSISQGFRLSSVADWIWDPAEGLLGYDDSRYNFVYFDGTSWKGMGPDEDWIIHPDGCIAGMQDVKVGIGTTTPGASLEVSGRIWQSGFGNSMYIGFYSGLDMLGLTDNKNTCIGFTAGQELTSSALYNTYIGDEAGTYSFSHNYNTAIGWFSQRLPTGSRNTSIGYLSMFGPVQKNCAAGAYASGDDASYCNAIGYESDVDNLLNTSVFGYQATGTANNQVRFGNSSVSSIGGYCDWTIIVDESIVVNIKEDVAGLDFILGLRPVSYSLNKKAITEHLQQINPRITDNYELAGIKASEGIIRTGFVAQEVYDLMTLLEFDFSGIDLPENDNDFYCLRYAEFVVPLVVSVQQQQEMIDNLKLKYENQKSVIEKLITDLNSIQE